MTRAVVLTALLMATPVTAQPADPKKSDQYFCYITKTAGITGHGATGAGVARQIDLPDHLKKFMITIEEIQRDPAQINACKNSAAAFLDALSRGDHYQDDDKIDPTRTYPREHLGRFCFAKDRLLLKRMGSDHPVEYESYNRFEFQGVTPDELFLFFRSGTFRMIEWLDDGTHAISEGQCEPISRATAR
jgi:hypothetical protein